MGNERKPLAWMIAFGIVRGLLSWLGGWLNGHGLIDADTHARLISEGAVQLLSYVLLIGPIAWSVVQKTQAWGWVVAALHLNPRTTSPGSVPMESGTKVTL